MQSRHHIIPKSRGGRDRDNIVMIDGRQHEKYHALFMNRTPAEIIGYLNQYFWRGRYRGLETYVQEQERR
jgi:hypothetical protein